VLQPEGPRHASPDCANATGGQHDVRHQLRPVSQASPAPPRAPLGRPQPAKASAILNLNQRE
jgi:hypothetical protein